MSKEISKEVQDAMFALGQALHDRRQRDNRRQSDLSRQVDVSENVIGFVEKGRGGNIASLVSILMGLGAMEDVIEALNGKANPIDSAEQGQMLKQAKEDRERQEQLREREEQGVSLDQLFIPRDELLLKPLNPSKRRVLNYLNHHPDRYYCVSKDTYEQLLDESPFNIALTSRVHLISNQNFDVDSVEELSDEQLASMTTRFRQVYYVTGLKGAAQSTLNWTVEGIARRHNMAFDIELPKNQIRMTLMDEVERTRRLRKYFKDMSVFIDEVRLNDNLTEPLLKHNQQLVEGKRFTSRLKQWAKHNLSKY